MAVRKRSAWDAFELPRGHLGNKLKCCPCTFFLNLPENPCWEPVERKHSPGIRASTDKLTISPGYIWENPVNPDELVWNHLKTHTVGRSTVTDKANFKKQVTKSMRSLQLNRRKIRSFYQKKSLKYAA